MSNALKDAFKGFDPNDLDLTAAGNWPIGIKVVCYILIMAAVGFGGWKFYIVDKKQTLERTVKKERDLKDIYRQKASQVANLELLQEQMKDVEEKFAVLKRQLPTEKEVPGLLDDITNLGTDSGLNIGFIGLAPETKQDFYIELPINIAVQGSYHQLGQFVSGIASLSRIVTLHDYSIAPSDEGEGVGMTISAKTYRYDESE